MPVAASDGNNIRPIGNVAPAVFVISRRNDRADGFEAYRVTAAASDGNNVRPVGNVALAVFVISRRNDRAVGFEAYRVNDATCDGNYIRPCGNVALAVFVIARRNDRAVGFEAYRVTAAASDGNNVRPVGNVALAVFVISRRNDRAVGFEAYRVVGAASDGNNIRPIGNVALAAIVISRRNDRAVGFEAYRVTEAASDGNNIRPVGNVALAVFVISRRNDRAVGFESYRVIAAASDGNNVRPCRNVALAVFVIARRNDRAVGFEAYRVPVAASYRLPFDEVVPKSSAAFASILVISGAAERYRRIFVFSVFIKREGFLVFTFVYFLRAVLISVHFFERDNCILIFAAFHKLNSGIIFTVWDNNLDENDNKGNNRNGHGNCDRKNSFFLLGGLLDGYAFCFFLLFYPCYSVSTFYNLLVCVSPASDALKSAYCILIVFNCINRHVFYRTVVYCVVSALFRFFKALPALFIGVLKAVNALKFICRCFKFVFLNGRIHSSYGFLIYSVLSIIFGLLHGNLTITLIALVYVGNIAV